MSILRRTAMPYYTLERLCPIALCCLLTATSACSQAYGKNYFPLSDSATWDYSGSYSSTDGKHFPVRGMMRVDGETIIHGQRYFKFVITTDFSIVPGEPQKAEDVRYYRVAQNGIYFLTGKDTNKPESLELPLPIPIGVKWLSGTTEAQAERAGTMKAAGREYTDCLKITYRPASGIRSTEYFLAPDVGIIKAVYVNNTEPKSTLEITLDKYKF